MLLRLAQFARVMRAKVVANNGLPVSSRVWREWRFEWIGEMDSTGVWAGCKVVVPGVGFLSGQGNGWGETVGV